MTCRDRLEGYLREHTVPFQLQRHYRATTAQQVAASEHIPGKMVAKVVLAFADGQLIMLVLPATSQVDFLKIALTLEAHQVRLATEHEFGGVFPDCEIGAMPPFGNLYGVPVYVDRALTVDEVIVFQAGTHTETIGLLYRDYAALVQPVVVDLGRSPLPPVVLVMSIQPTM